MPRDAIDRATPYNQWNACCHHHSGNNDDDDKICHSYHHDGDDRILSEQEWPFFKPHDTQKNGLGVAWVSRERKGHIDEKSEATDSDNVGPSVSIGSMQFDESEQVPILHLTKRSQHHQCPATAIGLADSPNNFLLEAIPGQWIDDHNVE